MDDGHLEAMAVLARQLAHDVDDELQVRLPAGASAAADDERDALRDMAALSIRPMSRFIAMREFTGFPEPR